MEASVATEQTKGHLYKYHALLIPKWPEGKNQIKAFIGTNVRAINPDNPSREGKVGCFIATKTDQ